MASSRTGSSLRRWILGLGVLAIMCVVGYDGVRTGLAASGVSDDATQVAHDAAGYYHEHPDVNATFNQATAEAAADGDTLPVQSFTITGTGTVSLTLDRTNATLVLGRMRPSLDTMTAEASGAWTP